MVETPIGQEARIIISDSNYAAFIKRVERHFKMNADVIIGSIDQ